MPHFANTPEAILPRTDSLDPASTCRGITSTGRPCRRALAPRSSKTDPQSLYCWQHKDQAQNGSNTTNNNGGTPGKDNRTSIDSMMGRLGLEDGNKPSAAVQGEQLPSLPPQRRRRRVRKTYCCCFEVWEDGDYLPPVRPSQRPQQHQGGRVSFNRPSQNQNQQPPSSTQAMQDEKKKKNREKSWIPPTIPTETASLLRSEMEKPLSHKDEPGYIYIFWLTPKETSTRAPPPVELLSTITTDEEAGDSLTRSPTTRSLSEAIRSAQDLNAFTSKPTNTDPGTIRLKIGRASNVQRRLNEWTRQCSYNLTLIRYYPYISHSGGSSPGVAAAGAGAGRKVPYAHRVEHLIHTELSDRRVRDLGKCPECGREHKEWFEIKAEKEELRRVDECIRRWVAWAESMESSSSQS
ncbi:hypothetical protein MPDQ_007264 [Monascus purpureus]|uniref:Bacteriophage T5 Orf172 DNA-binding domain-containing protein n=2 Tax=Monascus TaxID=5097 RepID=A0A507QSG4_MONPU|nr:hypothetical protein [Monascus ruber]TQB71757.1 hypothetical protein MPDQ_007264 [Monascus purpureus]BDD59500.1 hypothetical protein MAP00_004703 [Monascus purpureus]